MKTGVFLARMQPVHNAHLHMIEQACIENDKVIVMLGSADKKYEIRNPFPIELREVMLNRAILDKFKFDFIQKIRIHTLPDYTHKKDYENDKEWGLYLYYNILSKIKNNIFSIYYSDEPEIMLNWFDNNIKERINFRFFERNSLFEGLSATKIREAIINNDRQYIESFCPKSVINNLKTMQDILNNVKENNHDTTN